MKIQMTTTYLTFIGPCIILIVDSGIQMQASACIRIPHHPQQNHNVTSTRIVQEQYNSWNNSTNKSQAPEDGCINIRNTLSMK